MPYETINQTLQPVYEELAKPYLSLIDDAIEATKEAIQEFDDEEDLIAAVKDSPIWSDDDSKRKLVIAGWMAAGQPYKQAICWGDFMDDMHPSQAIQNAYWAITDRIARVAVDWITNQGEGYNGDPRDHRGNSDATFIPNNM